MPCSVRVPPRLSLAVVSGLLGVLVGCRENPESPTSPSESATSLLATTATPALTFRQVSVGRNHTCGVTLGDRAYCWGSNLYGELGDGTTGTSRTSPRAVIGGLRFRQVDVGDGHTCGVTTANVGYCWGFNLTGQLGDGTTIDRLRPVKVVGGHRFTQVIAAGSISCGLNTEEEAYCWGGNAIGQIGDGTTMNRLTPVAVVGGHHFLQLSTGGGNGTHTCGVTLSNLAYCWGFNNAGQLGDGTFINRGSPVLVVGGHRFRQVSAGTGLGGDSHTCGVTLANVGYCWGSADDGQLGDGTTAGFRPKPVLVRGGHPFRTIARVGDVHTCGVTTLNVAFCWGSNDSFQLGVGPGGPNPSLRPAAVVGGIRFLRMSAGGDHTCGVATDNLAYCWGSGNLGNGTTDPSATPVAVGGPM
jgi:alpha-tubulin suppressor-like RCC1 family protein